MWIDRRPPRYHAGDVVFFEGPAQELHFGELREIRPRASGGEELWIEIDDPRCPGADSRTLGWIARERMRGRLVFALAEP